MHSQRSLRSEGSFRSAARASPDAVAGAGRGAGAGAHAHGRQSPTPSEAKSKGRARLLGRLGGSPPPGASLRAKMGLPRSTSPMPGGRPTSARSHHSDSSTPGQAVSIARCNCIALSSSSDGCLAAVGSSDRTVAMYAAYCVLLGFVASTRCGLMRCVPGRYDASKPYGAISQFLADGVVTTVALHRHEDLSTIGQVRDVAVGVAATRRRRSKQPVSDAHLRATEKIMELCGSPVICGDASGHVYVLNLVDTEVVARADRWCREELGVEASLRGVHEQQRALQAQLEVGSAASGDAHEEEEENEGAGSVELGDVL